MRRTTKILACLLVMCMLIAALPMGTLFASAETMSAEPSKNSTPAANWIVNNSSVLTPSVATAASAAAFTSKANGYTFDLTETGYTAIGGTVNAEYAVNVVKNNFGTNGSWSLDFDLNAGAAFTGKGDYRTVLNLGHITTADGKKNNNAFRVMLQGGTLHVTKSQGTTSYGWKSVGSIGMTIPNGGKIHFSYVIKEYKVIDITISNGTKTFTYSWNIADDWGANYTVDLLPTFTISHKNIYIDVSNLKVSCEKAGVTAPTADNNLVGTWTANYKNTKYPFTAEGNSFYLNTSVEGQVAGGLTSYTSAFEAVPFNANVLSNTKSYVISANTARANASNQHPDTGANVVARVYYYFGKYNGTDFMIYFDKNGYHWCKEGYKTYTQNNLLKNVALNEYARITAYVTPFGVEIYVNGEFLTSMAIEDPSLFAPRFTFRSAGTEVWFKDVAIWENTANGDEYYDALSSQYFEFTAPGVRTDLDLTALGAALNAYKAGSANTTLAPFVNTFVGATKTVVNNLVLDGTTAVGTSASKYFAHATDKDWNYGNILLFNGASPFTPESDFIVEADYTIKEVWNNTRIGFAFNNVGAGDTFIQGSDVYVSGAKHTGTISGTKPTVKNVSNRWHVKFIVKGGESLRAVITDSNTGALLYDYTAAWSSLKADSVNKTNYSPVLYFTCGNFDIKNLYVGYDVTEAKDALSATVTEYAAKDTNGFTAETVKTFTDALAAANTILGAYTKYSNAEINAAAAAVVSAFGALEEATIKVPVGDIEIDIAPDAKLPEKVKPEGTTKFILGWKNPDGTAYEGTTYVEGLVADYVETLMMTVKYQLGTSGNAIRYIASVDQTDRYAKVGWAFSLTNANPEIGGANVVVRDSSLVYNSLLANGVEKSAADIYGGADYAQYLYVFEITDIPEAAADSIIYVRPYVEMNDGTIVYGEVSTQSLAGLKTR